VTAKEYLKRRDEPHYRVTPGQLADLLSEYEQDQQEGVQDIDAHRGIDGYDVQLPFHYVTLLSVHDTTTCVLALTRTHAQCGC
jgi:hypothetical protein